MSFQPLATTPSLQAMNDNLSRNMWTYREVQDGGVEGVDEGEETESAYEEDEDVEIHSPPPEVEVDVEVEVAAKEEK